LVDIRDPNLPITSLTHVFHQTRNNTTATINKAQGRLLLVRGIHELNTTPRKNIDELVEVLSSVAELAQLVVVFAGEVSVTNDLLRRYPQLAACLPEEVCLPDFTPMQCLEILKEALRRARVDVRELRDDKSKRAGNSTLESPLSNDNRLAIIALFQDLVAQHGWKNAIDIQRLASEVASMHTKAMGARGSVVRLEMVLDTMQQWVDDRQYPSK
jgi:hypothetical protein